MAEYKSAYTGEQIDAGIGKANTAVQPATLEASLAGKQNTLVSGVNIKTINDQSILGSGNIVIQCGGGSSDFNVRVVDATNPDDWSEENDGPSQAVLEDVTTNEYSAIRLINIPIDEYGSTYELDMFLTASITAGDDVGDGGAQREYMHFDSGDEEEGEPAYVQTFTFTKDGEDPTQMSVDEFPLSGGGSGGNGTVFLQDVYLGGNDGDEVSLDLVNITSAIDSAREVIIRVQAGYDYPTRYFRIATQPANKEYISGPDVDCWLPTFKCISNVDDYYMEFDGYQSEAFIFKIYAGAQKFTPTAIDIANNSITFDVDDYSYIYNNQPKNITLNLGDSGADLWIDFKLAISDKTQGEESYNYISNIIPDHTNGTEMTVFTLLVYNDGGNVSTKIYIDQLTTSVPV